VTDTRHNCDFDGNIEMPCDGYGAAITRCVEDEEGKFWVDNGEYCTQVAYCPYCGEKAPSVPVPTVYVPP
jgi:hypothetical protein